MTRTRPHLHRLLPIALLLLALAACGGPQLYQRQLISLDKGMSEAQASRALAQLPRASYRTEVDSVDYRFQRYLLNNGRYADTYLLGFEAGRLRYWGYIDEFRRYPDARVNRAIEAILPQLRQPVQ